MVSTDVPAPRSSGRRVRSVHADAHRPPPSSADRDAPRSWRGPRGIRVAESRPYLKDRTKPPDLREAAQVISESNIPRIYAGGGVGPTYLSVSLTNAEEESEVTCSCEPQGP